MKPNIQTRTQALSGQLLGKRVRIEVPYRGGQYAEVGTVSGLAYPLVEVDTGGDTKRYRHIDDITLS